MLIVIVKLITALFGLATSYLVFIALRRISAEREFKRRSPNLPWPVPGDFFTGHANSWLYASRAHENLATAHEKHGKTVAFMYKNKPLVSTLDLDLIKVLNVDEANVHVNRFNLGILMNEFNYDNIIFVEDDQWRRIRKAYAPAFSARKVKSEIVQEQIQGCIDKFLESIEWRLNEAEKKEGNQSGIELNVEDMFLRYALDLIFTCFYRQPNVIDYYAPKDEWAELSDSFPRTMISPLWRFGVLFSVLNPILSWLALHLHPTGAFRKRLRKYILDQLELHVSVHREARKAGERAENFTSSDGTKFRRHLMDYVTDRHLEGMLTSSEYLHSTQGLQIAADKTSSECLSKTIYLLSIHPNVQEKVREAVIREGAESEYLEWVIYESMRMFSPTKIGATRTAKRDIESEVGLIPKGTIVFTPSYLIHKLKEYWGEDAEEFRPERWADAAKFHPTQYLAFGAGKRRCPGEALAMIEIKSVMSQMLQRYTFGPSDRTDPNLRHEAPVMIFIVFDKPTYVRFERLKAKAQQQPLKLR